jgi:hypothetical protein
MASTSLSQQWINELCPASTSRTLRHSKHFSQDRVCPLCKEPNPNFQSTQLSPLPTRTQVKSDQYPSEIIEISSSPIEDPPARFIGKAEVRTQTNPTILAFANREAINQERRGTFTSRTQTSGGKASAIIKSIQLSVRVCVRILDKDDDGYPVLGEPRLVGKRLL